MEELINDIDVMRSELLALEDKIKQKKRELKELKTPICGRVKIDIRKDTNNYLLYIRDCNLEHWKWIKCAASKDDINAFIDGLISDLKGIKKKI